MPCNSFPDASRATKDDRHLRDSMRKHHQSAYSSKEHPHVHGRSRRQSLEQCPIYDACLTRAWCDVSARQRVVSLVSGEQAWYTSHELLWEAVAVWEFVLRRVASWRCC
jgi:hypothetical protein